MTHATAKEGLNMDQQMMTYLILDTLTGRAVGRPYTGRHALQRARARAEKLDLEYGAYRYTVQRSSVAHVLSSDGR